MYRYPYPHPAVATDVAIFTLRDGALAVLLIRRKGEPFEGAWALPGGFLKEDEDLDACAARELSEEAGLSAGVLQHFGNFSAPERDPRERVISVAYFALVSSDRVTPEAGSDKAKILSAGIFIADIGTFAEMNAVWDGWVSPGNTPCRTTIETKLAAPKYAIEISIVAAV